MAMASEMANHAAKGAADIKAAVDDAYAAAIKVAKARNAAQRTGTPQININRYFYVAVRNILRVESRDGSWLGRRLLVSVIEADLQSYGNDRGEAWGLNAKWQGASERERRPLTKD
jgi:hypothetical protein